MLEQINLTKKMEKSVYQEKMEVMELSWTSMILKKKSV